MQGGDISNLTVPRLVIVWDDLLGVLPNKTAQAKLSTYLKFHRWKKAVGLYEVNEAVARRLWDITWRTSYSIDLVTFTGGEEFAEALRERLDRENLPIGHLWYQHPHQLARDLAYRMDIACVFFANPQYLLTFGSKGRQINSSSPDLFGAL